MEEEKSRKEVLSCPDTDGTGHGAWGMGPSSAKATEDKAWGMEHGE